MPWLLLLLVQLPTAALAGLGFRAADAFDATDAARLQSEQTAAGRDLEQALRVGTAGAAAGIEVALRAAAAGIRDRAAAGGAQTVPAELQAAGLHVQAATLFDVHGRGLWPAEYVPAAYGAAEQVTGGSASPSAGSLFHYLRRRADRAAFGDGGLDAAARIWRDARERLQCPTCQCLADVELARVRVRAEPGSAERELVALQERWGATPPEDAEAARPWLLLEMTAAGTSPLLQARLAERVVSGQTARIPLTVEERRRLGLLAGASSSHADGATRVVAFQAPVAQGARLEVQIAASELIRLVQAQLERPPSAPLQVRLTLPGPSAGALTPEARGGSISFALPGEVPALALYEHRERAQVEARQHQRRVLLSIGVTLLFLLTTLGLVLTRRAMARERAARRLRDEFIANVTHEVRTPLTSVLLHSEMLADEDGDAGRRRDHANVVKAQGRRLAQLVDDMLDFSALERGTRMLECVPVDLDAACREAVAPYVLLAEREGVELRYHEAGSEVAGMGDPAALARILSNLLGNAWKHGRPARTGAAGRIDVRAYEEGQRATIEVGNDGPEIPRAEREQIFTRFGRGRAAHLKEGAGIGLALSHDLARAMGGTLDVREVAQDTIFRLRLPAVPSLGDEAESAK